MPTVFPLGQTVLFVDTVDPTATDDQVTIGVRRGFFWLNTSNSSLFACVDATQSAAEWKEIVGADRTINTENGITGGGDLTSDLTFSLEGSALHLHLYTDGAGTNTTEVPRGFELGGAAFLEPIALSGVFSSIKTAPYTIVPTDFRKMIITASGATSLTLPAASSLPDGWWCMYRNRSGASINLLRVGSDTLNNGATSVAAANNSRIGIAAKTSNSTFEVA